MFRAPAGTSFNRPSCGRNPMPNVSELRHLVALRKRLLAEAEADSAAALKRPPAVGDFARSTLTRFYGRVTNVVQRPSGRPWVEITPYLTPTLPGRGTLDLYDFWGTDRRPRPRHRRRADRADGRRDCRPSDRGHRLVRRAADSGGVEVGERSRRAPSSTLSSRRSSGIAADGCPRPAAGNGFGPPALLIHSLRPHVASAAYCRCGLPCRIFQGSPRDTCEWIFAGADPVFGFRAREAAPAAPPAGQAKG